MNGFSHNQKKTRAKTIVAGIITRIHSQFITARMCPAPRLHDQRDDVRRIEPALRGEWLGESSFAVFSGDLCVRNHVNAEIAEKRVYLCRYERRHVDIVLPNLTIKPRTIDPQK